MGSSREELGARFDGDDGSSEGSNQAVTGRPARAGGGYANPHMPMFHSFGVYSRLEEELRERLRKSATMAGNPVEVESMIKAVRMAISQAVLTNPGLIDRNAPIESRISGLKDIAASLQAARAPYANKPDFEASYAPLFVQIEKRMKEELDLYERVKSSSENPGLVGFLAGMHEHLSRDARESKARREAESVVSTINAAHEHALGMRRRQTSDYRWEKSQSSDDVKTLSRLVKAADEAMQRADRDRLTPAFDERVRKLHDTLTELSKDVADQSLSKLISDLADSLAKTFDWALSRVKSIGRDLVARSPYASRPEPSSA